MSQLKLVVFSDFHAHDFQDFAKPENIKVSGGEEVQATDRIREQLETLDKVFEIAQELSEGQGFPTAILFAGDFFHARGRVSTLIYNLMYNKVREFMEKDIVPMYMIVGNHDQRDTTRKPEHSLEPFKAIKGVTVLDSFEKLTIGDNVDLYPLSYSEDTPYLKEVVSGYREEMKVNKDATNILLGHLGVDGSLAGQHTHRLEGEFQIKDLYPKEFDFVALGHYHKRQFLGGTNNAFYVGNTIQTTFSDEGETKGVMIIDTEADTANFLEIPNRLFITIDKFEDDTEQLMKDNFVRAILPEAEARKLQGVLDTYGDDMETPLFRLEVERDYGSDTRIDIDVESSEEDIVRAYCKEFDKEHISDIALTILQEAKQNQVSE